jgi:hypothetical protein
MNDAWFDRDARESAKLSVAPIVLWIVALVCAVIAWLDWMI